MAYEHKEGQGSIFRNEKQNDRQPDYKGTIVINGTTYEIAGWERTSQKGSSYISLQANLPRVERDAQNGGQPAQRQQYQRPAPRYSPPGARPEPAPMPIPEDMPDFGPGEDLPF